MKIISNDFFDFGSPEKALEDMRTDLFMLIRKNLLRCEYYGPIDLLVPFTARVINSELEKLLSTIDWKHKDSL